MAQNHFIKHLENNEGKCRGVKWLQFKGWNQQIFEGLRYWIHPRFPLYHTFTQAYNVTVANKL